MPVDWGGAVVYGLLLMWSFVGVSIIADVFMSAIEVITSAEKLVQVGVGDAAPRVPVKVWNATVANLTLMALGSSAPSLLGCIEILTNDFVAGELGPGVIVGSAAFNLLIIIAVCIVAIPTGETRKIAELGVFSITAASSVLAYLWMYLILALSSPNVMSSGRRSSRSCSSPCSSRSPTAPTRTGQRARRARARVAPQVASRREDRPRDPQRLSRRGRRAAQGVRARRPQQRRRARCSRSSRSPTRSSRRARTAASRRSARRPAASASCRRRRPRPRAPRAEARTGTTPRAPPPRTTRPRGATRPARARRGRARRGGHVLGRRVGRAVHELRGARERAARRTHALRGSRPTGRSRSCTARATAPRAVRRRGRRRRLRASCGG